MRLMHEQIRRGEPPRRPAVRSRLRRQRGQALIYGLFMLTGGLAALFFLFNVGQLSHEKTRLVNAADAVAYSAGLVEARTMNFAAYANRALVANEVAIAQAVSLASWLQYMERHGQVALSLGCFPYPTYSRPAYALLLKYTVTCWSIGGAQSTGVTPMAREAFDASIPPLIRITETVKTALKGGLTALPALSLAARSDVMEQVARANYQGLGEIEVANKLQSTFLLRDDYAQYGSGDRKRLALESFTRNDSGTDRRQRMADMAVRAVRMDGFTPERAWNDRGQPPGCWWDWGSRPKVDRSGGTNLVSFDEWRASDKATFTTYHGSVRNGRLRCRSNTLSLGTGRQSASTATWGYSGIPSYLELTEEALRSADPRLVYAVQLRRPISQTATSGHRSATKSTDRINAYKANTVADDSLYSLAGVEVYFQRPRPRADGQAELPSLFNPFWHVHLVELPKEVQQKALALLGATGS